jgi:hypothetical protein
LAIVFGKNCSHLCLSIDIGCFDELVTITAHDGFKVINCDKKDVGFLVLLSNKVETQQ